MCRDDGKSGREDRRENQRNEDSGSDLWGMCGRFSGNMGVCELFGVEEEAEGCQTKENGPGQEMIWWRP